MKKIGKNILIILALFGLTTVTSLIFSSNIKALGITKAGILEYGSSGNLYYAMTNWPGVNHRTYLSVINRSGIYTNWSERNYNTTTVYARGTGIYNYGSSQY